MRYFIIEVTRKELNIVMPMHKFPLKNCFILFFFFFTRICDAKPQTNLVQTTKFEKNYMVHRILMKMYYTQKAMLKICV